MDLYNKTNLKNIANKNNITIDYPKHYSPTYRTPVSLGRDLTKEKILSRTALFILVEHDSTEETIRLFSHKEVLYV